MKRPSICRDCGDAIWFAKSSHAKWFPLDGVIEPLPVGADAFIMVETDAGLIAVRPGNAHIAHSHIENCRAKKDKKNPQTDKGDLKL